MPLSRHRKRTPDSEMPTSTDKKPIFVYIVVYAMIALMVIGLFGLMLT